jgi:DNA-binding NtrC family response regulator
LYFNDARDIAEFVQLECARIDCILEIIEQPEVGVGSHQGGLQPMAVMVDVFMPRVPVEDLLTEIRSVIPHVLVTATPKSKESAARLNAADYLEKSFEPERFVEMVSRFIPSVADVHSGRSAEHP